MEIVTLTLNDKEYQIEKIGICPNPVCDCGTIEFTLDDATVALDVTRKRFVDNLGAEREISQKVAETLTDEQWEFLLSWYHEQKSIITDNIEDYAQLSYDFSQITIEEGNIFYDTVFPNADPFMFEHEGAAFAVIDQYCLNPECSCKEVILSFYKAEENIQQMPLMNCVLDYQKDRFLPLEAGDTLDRKLIASFMKATPHYARIYKKRHAGLRLMFMNYLQKILSEEEVEKDVPFIAPPRVGRNDPCPCGSGKKFKKCCGANR